MSIKTYEIHNSYLQDSPDSTGITRMVSEADYISQLQKTDALQTSLNNIINAFGISGEGAHSKMVIEYVHGLVAENAALKAAFNPVEIPEDAVDALGNTAEFDWDSNESGSWTWVENDTDVIRAVLDAMPKPETPLTEAFTSELRAQGVDEFARTFNSETIEGSSMVMVAKTFAANLRAGRKG